jgi:hypothetical protein
MLSEATNRPKGLQRCPVVGGGSKPWAVARSYHDRRNVSVRLVNELAYL